jgi:hypothetical protein
MGHQSIAFGHAAGRRWPLPRVVAAAVLLALLAIAAYNGLIAVVDFVVPGSEAKALLRETLRDEQAALEEVEGVTEELARQASAATSAAAV